MSTVLATLILAALPAPLADGVPLRIEGHCQYSPELVERADTAILVPCGEATLSGQGITFAARGFDPSIMFVGEWDGDELIVTQVARRGQDRADDADGFCRVQLREQAVSAIVCSVIAGPRSYVANFVVPNI